MSEEYKITAGTISGATFKSIDIEPSIIVDGKNYTASEFNKAVEMLKQPQLNENQQEMLQEVIKQYDNTKPKTVLHALEHLSMIAYLLDEMEEVTEEDCIVVAQAFLDWAQEQEEKQ